MVPPPQDPGVEIKESFSPVPTSEHIAGSLIVLLYSSVSCLSSLDSRTGSVKGNLPAGRVAWEESLVVEVGSVKRHSGWKKQPRLRYQDRAAAVERPALDPRGKGWGRLRAKAWVSALWSSKRAPSVA